MTPAILLVLSIITIHIRQRFFALLSFLDMSISGKKLNIEIFLSSLIEDYTSILEGYGHMNVRINNSLFIKILDRDYSTHNIFSNSLEYRKTSDGLVYLTD